MTKRDLINKVKYSKILYNIYFYLGSLALKLLALFVKQDSKLIVFSSFGGRKYDDSPRAIFETMLQDQRFKDYKFVWALGEPEKFSIPDATVVKCDTLKYYLTILRAKVWVTNSSMERGLYFKPKRIFNFNTWHGSPIKRMGTDIQAGNTSFSTNCDNSHDDIMLAQSQFDVDVFSRAFGIPKDHFRIIGLPRNDELTKGSDQTLRTSIRQKLGIPANKKVILYAPTFREYDKDNDSNCILRLPVDFEKWQQELGSNYVVLMRAHYEVVKFMNIHNSDFLKDVSAYPNLNELMIASDMLISDYSSIFFDYSIQDKPMLVFAFDYDKYAQTRGMYFDIRQELQSDNTSEQQLLQSILTLNTSDRIAITQHFRKKYIQAYGNASKQSVEIILKYV